jgi:CHAD domain-containing protein
MASLIDDLLAQVLGLQVRLYACCARLSAGTDGEALHDLRVALRALRSLLKPIKQLAGCAILRQRAAELGRLSGPLRDLEVLLAELQRHGAQPAGAQMRVMQVQQGYAALLASPQLQALFAAFDDFPARWYQAAAQGELKGMGKRIGKRLAKQRRRLLDALADPGQDRHHLRLLIKRVRYGAEAYPNLADISRAQGAHLKRAQTALGDWHDHMQWLARAEVEADLTPYLETWRRALRAAEQRSDEALLALRQKFQCRYGSGGSD